MNAGRAASSTAPLARAGFIDTTAAQMRLVALDLDEESRAELLEDLSRAADPDQALAVLGDLPESGQHAVLTDPRIRRSLCIVAGASEALGRHLIRRPEQVEVLASSTTELTADRMRAGLLEAVGANAHDAWPTARGAGFDVLDDLRIAYRRLLLTIAVGDLVHEWIFDHVGRLLAELADAALEAALAIARADLPEDAAPVSYTHLTLPTIYSV